MVIAGLGFYQSGFAVTVISGEALSVTALESPAVATIGSDEVTAIVGPGAIIVTIPED